MPFVSQAQRSACYAQAAQAKREGRKPKWDCKKYEKHSKKRRSATGKRRSKNNYKKRSKRRSK